MIAKRRRRILAQDFRVNLSNFRAFSETGLINIRPLTILVGENSTGKTSFLAALRYCFDLTQRPKSGYFNIPPFDLGSYDDIVHQSSQSSTNQRFSLTVEKTVDVATGGTMIMNPKAKPNLQNCTFRVFFCSRFGDVSLSSFVFLFEDIKIEYGAGQNSFLKIFFKEREIKLPDRTRGFFKAEVGDIRAEDLRSISYKIFDYYFSSSATTKGKKRDDSYILSAAQGFDAFISSTYSLHSSPPVRSVPRRVYTSSDEVGFADQTHAPHELNRLKRADHRRWSRLNNGLNRFGKLSGLFTRFDITKLTRQDAGPFQLKVTVRGRSSNLADVGYGVSQSLPIMTDLIESRSDRSAFLFQQPEVHLHPRAQAALGTIFSEFISDHPKSYIISETHSDYLIDRIRIEVRNGKISSDMVSILYFEPKDNDVSIHQIYIDNSGNVVGAPPSYRYFFISEQEKVLGL